MEFAKAIAWISTAVAVIIGMKITESPWCLWAFFITIVNELKLRDNVDVEFEILAEEFKR